LRKVVLPEPGSPGERGRGSFQEIEDGLRFASAVRPSLDLLFETCRPRAHLPRPGLPLPAPARGPSRGRTSRGAATAEVPDPKRPCRGSQRWGSSRPGTPRIAPSPAQRSRWRARNQRMRSRRGGQPEDTARMATNGRLVGAWNGGKSIAKIGGASLSPGRAGTGACPTLPEGHLSGKEPRRRTFIAIARFLIGCARSGQATTIPEQVVMRTADSVLLTAGRKPHGRGDVPRGPGAFPGRPGAFPRGRKLLPGTGAEFPGIQLVSEDSTPFPRT